MKREWEPDEREPRDVAAPGRAPAPSARLAWTPGGVLALQRAVGNAAVARAVIARAAPTVEAEPEPKDRFEGKSYDFKTKQGVLEHIRDWHTQLLWDYTHYMDRVVVTPQQLEAGRAFFIYSTHYQPTLEQDVETKPLMDVVRATIKAVNDAQAEARTEEASGRRLKAADYRQLFPELHAREYETEAVRLRQEADKQRATREEYKVKAAAEGDRKSFIDWAEYQTYQLFAAKRHEQEAAKIRKGQFDVLTFSDHKLFFEFDARDEARAAAETEWDAYVVRAKDPRGTWETGHQKQWQEDLDKQGKDAAGDLLSVEVFAVQKRLELGAEVLPKNVVETWRAAELALTAINPAIRAGKVPPDAQNAAADAFDAFYKAFRAHVAPLDKSEEIQLSEEEGGGKATLTTNPYLGGALLEYFVQRLRDAKTAKDWQWPVDRYKGIVAALDRYIADQLTLKGRKAEGEELKAAGATAKALGTLLERKKNVQKVRAVFYPRDQVANAGEPGTPDFRAKGIPLNFYLYREDDEWHLVDVTTPHQVRVNSESGGSETYPPDELFEELNTKLRFPHGRLYWQLPGDKAWMLETDEPTRLSEWLTWIGLTAGAVALAILTMGASVPTTVIVIGGVAGAAAAAADMYEKSEAGVLTTKDIVVDALSIVGNLASLGALGLGRVVAGAALRTGPYAQLAKYADNLFMPVTLTAVGADVASFMILAGDAKAQLDAIDKMEGSEEDRTLARARLVGQLLLAGTITLLSVKGGLPGMRRGQHLYLDTEPNGTLIARPSMSDDELLKAGAKLDSPESVTELLKRTDLPQATLDRMRAAISQALSVGPVERGLLQDLLARLKTAQGPEVQAILAELTARSRVGAYLGSTMAGAVNGQTAVRLNDLEADVLVSLRGATPGELERVAELVGRDAPRTNALIKEFGGELMEHLRFNPVRSVDALEKALADARKQVKDKVPGFFEGIDPNGPPPAGLTFKDVEFTKTKGGSNLGKSADWPDQGVRVIQTTVEGAGGTKGYFERTYDPATGQIEMKMAFLRMGGREKGIPGKVTHAGQQMTPDGSPTVQYVTLYQLKRLGVPAGGAGVKEIAMRDIQNIETIVHLHWLRKQFPTTPLEELIAQTASVKYARTSAIQSGFEPVPPYNVVGGGTQEIKGLLDFQARGNATRIKEHEALLAKYGFTEDSEMLMSFDITFGVRPK